MKNEKDSLRAQWISKTEKNQKSDSKIKIRWQCYSTDFLVQNSTYFPLIFTFYDSFFYTITVHYDDIQYLHALGRPETIYFNEVQH